MSSGKQWAMIWTDVIVTIRGHSFSFTAMLNSPKINTFSNQFDGKKMSFKFAEEREELLEPPLVSKHGNCAYM